jgi:hypothetical protein
MNLCIQGQAVIEKMFDAFRIKYVEENPGVNGNDVEREFLLSLMHGLQTFPLIEDMFSDEDRSKLIRSIYQIA